MCGCTLSPGKGLPWPECAKGEIPLLLKRVQTPGGPTPQASIPSFGANIVDAYPTPTFHDPTAEGMWLFADVVAKHRTRYNIVVKIEYHADAHVSGLREGRVLSDPNPLQNPLPLSTRPNVDVLYMDVFQQRRVESMPVAALRPTSKMKEKGLHLIVKGERAGTLVIHLKSDGPMARVHAVCSHKSTAFHMEKSKMCIVERLETEEPV
ncbi:hypothetical protein SCHPADRAFT_5924 [Schizopora paradoxa]|uniref:Uncharacterized protein n=1 Tax=Schizopora paradoxa TaxID=27342 RepID=A0A0H2S9C2_9AGAM|nr:hypothetical protein SCHPADRAFT_5924 [Schizopora paradoxa]